jgi:plastocyanin
MTPIRSLWAAPAARAAGQRSGQPQRGRDRLTRTIQIGLLAGILALAAMAPASAQVGVMNGPARWNSGPGLWDYTGVLTPYGYYPPRFPYTWITPNYVLNYQEPLDAPRVVYVPVPTPVPQPAPAVAPVQVATITLRRGTAPADVRVKPGTVVVWTNSGNEEATLIFPQLGQAGTGGQGDSQRWLIRPGSSFSLAFNQPAVYDYYEAQAPGYRAHVIVTQ